MSADYLMTIKTLNGCSIHAYLMTDDPRYIEHTASLMMDEAERQGLLQRAPANHDDAASRRRPRHGSRLPRRCVASGG